MQDGEDKDILQLVDESGNPIDDNTPLGDFDDDDLHVAGVTTPPEPAGKVEQPPTQDDDALKRFRESYDAIKAQNEQLQREVTESKKREAEHAKTRRESEKEILTHALAGSKLDLENAKRDYAVALQENRYDDAATLQERIADAKLDIRQYEDAMEEFARRPDPAPAAPEPKTEQPASIPHAQAVDNFIKGMRPNTGALAAKYKDQIFPEGDPRPLQRVLAIEQLARARGLEPDSSEYIAYIEKQMLGDGDFKPAGAPTPEPKTTTRPTPQRTRPPMPSAPVNGGGAQNNDSVVLSRAEQKIARSMGMTNQAYAKHKKTMLDNANNPEYTGPRYSKDDPANSRR